MMKYFNTVIATQISLAVLTAGEVLAESAGHHADAHAKTVHDAAHAVSSHGAEHASGGGGLPQLDPTWYPSQLFWLLITFGCLYILFSKNVLPALSGTIEKRRTQIDNDLNTARDMRQKAEDVHDAYEEALQEARTNANNALLKAEKSAKDKAAKALEKMREKSAEQLDKAEANLLTQKAKALKDMDTIAAEVAAEAAKAIVGISTDPKQAKTVIDNINKKAA